MSALPPKADMCSALGHVRFGPKADMARRGLESPHLGYAAFQVCFRFLFFVSFGSDTNQFVAL